MILNANQELIIRLLVFASVLSSMLFWEAVFPRRAVAEGSWLRRCHNLVLVFVNTLCLRLVLPVAAVGAAELASSAGWGLFNRIQMGYWLTLLLSLMVLDLIIYVQHVLFHKIQLLWRVHRVHHTDMAIDVTTGLRFHPIEIFISMCIKIIAVMLLGVPALAVMLFEVILNATAMFNHSNIYITPGVDHWIRWLIVTPDMHRVHHSVIRRETDSNYGFNLSCWDRLFRTYRDQPREGHLNMRIGLNELRGEKTVNILWLLAQPFLGVQQASGV
ncbi:MAG: sterol desaturase family protein [Gammaproteobacteria bacterium]